MVAVYNILVLLLTILVGHGISCYQKVIFTEGGVIDEGVDFVGSESINHDDCICVNFSDKQDEHMHMQLS